MNRDDEVCLRDLTIKLTIGVHPHERERVQPVLVSVTLYGDTRMAGRSDELTKTFDYERVHQCILELAKTSAFHLLEALAEQIAQMSLRETHCQRVCVFVRKENILEATMEVSVRIFRDQRDVSV